MNRASQTPIPRRIVIALRVFWMALISGVVLGLYIELLPIYERMQSLKDENPFQASIPVGLLLAAVFLLLTPKFIGSVVAAAMLVLVARRKSWSRWVLFAGILASGAVLGSSFSALLANDVPRYQALALVLQGALYLAMVAAMIQLLSAEASEWFRNPVAVGKETQHDVA